MLFEVVIVPQNEKQSQAVKDLIPNINPVKKQGGEIFIVRFIQRITQMLFAVSIYP